MHTASSRGWCHIHLTLPGVWVKIWDLTTSHFSAVASLKLSVSSRMHSPFRFLVVSLFAGQLTHEGPKAKAMASADGPLGLTVLSHV